MINNKQKPLISVIMAAYNAEKYIAEAVYVKNFYRVIQKYVIKTKIKRLVGIKS